MHRGKIKLFSFVILEEQVGTQWCFTTKVKTHHHFVREKREELKWSVKVTLQ